MIRGYRPPFSRHLEHGLKKKNWIEASQARITPSFLGRDKLLFPTCTIPSSNCTSSKQEAEAELYNSLLSHVNCTHVCHLKFSHFAPTPCADPKPPWWSPPEVDLQVAGQRQWVCEWDCTAQCRWRHSHTASPVKEAQKNGLHMFPPELAELKHGVYHPVCPFCWEGSFFDVLPPKHFVKTWTSQWQTLRKDSIYLSFSGPSLTKASSADVP